MTKDRLPGWPELDPSLVAAEEAAFSRSPYHDDVARLFGTLSVHLPTCRERLGEEFYARVRDNVQVLAACFYGEPLTPAAVEVIHMHLETLSRALAFRLN